MYVYVPVVVVSAVLSAAKLIALGCRVGGGLVDRRSEENTIHRSGGRNGLRSMKLYAIKKVITTGFYHYYGGHECGVDWTVFQSKKYVNLMINARASITKLLHNRLLLLLHHLWQGVCSGRWSTTLGLADRLGFRVEWLAVWTYSGAVM